jgi:hypothetical protein
MEMNNKEPEHTIGSTAKYGIAMALGGFLCIGSAACLVSGLFPEWVRRTFDMSEWTFPSWITITFGWCMVVGLPFMIIGGWVVLRITDKIRTKIRKADRDRDAPCLILPR